MSDSSEIEELSEAESLDMELENLLANSITFEGFSNTPRREDYPDLWEQEWGEDGDGEGSSEGSSTQSEQLLVPADDRLGTNDWCICTCCSSMPTAVECVCCKELSALENFFNEQYLTCIIDHPSYSIFTSRVVLENTLWVIHHTRNDPINFDDPKSLRWAAFKQFTAWVYGRLGKGVRKVIPACVVTDIRKRYPNPPGIDYIGFIDTTLDD